MPCLPYLEHSPELGGDCQLEPTAYVVGRVRIAGPAALGASAVLRGDQNEIDIRPRFRIGQRSTIHVEQAEPTRLGVDVWIGDDAVIHGCRLGDCVRVEDGALVLSGSSVGSGSVVAAGSLVSEGATFADDSYISGTPGRRLRDTTPEERAETRARVSQSLP